MTDGLVVVDKPPAWTSHDVVAKCRGIFRLKRIGHAGTLDPDATGVLLVGLGRVTRLLRFLSDLPKSYTAEVVLGVATSTLDASGDVVGEWDMRACGIGEVRAAAASLTGPILQVPPMVSAVKVDGRRLHELARAGVEVERQPRPVTVHRFDVDPAEEPGVFNVTVECSSGTFVRSLADDLGAALGGGAHLRRLRRTAIGPFGEGEARPLESVGAGDVLPPAAALPHLRKIEVDAAAEVAVGYGRELPDLPEETVAVVGPDGSLLAVYERRRPVVVLAAR